jgi:DNA-binding beta-propeller fold protein YncE
VLYANRRFGFVGSALISASVTLWCSEVRAEKELAYVSNQKGPISVVDLETLEIVSEIGVDSAGSRGLGVTRDGKWLVAANGENGELALIERASGKLIKRIPIGRNPEFVRVRGDYAFVSFEPSSKAGPPLAAGSKQSEALPKEREEGDGMPAKVAVVDLARGQSVREITGGMETEGIEFSADGKNILITNEADENVSIHEIESGKLVKTVSTKEIGSRPRGIKIAPDGKSYAVTLEFGNKLAVLDSDFKIVRSVPTGEMPYGIAFDRKGDRLFVALSKGQALQVFDTKTWRQIAVVPTGERCWHFSFTPDDAKIMMACGRSSEIVIIDAKNLKPIKRLADGKMPWGIVTFPKSVGSLDTPP